MPFHEPTTDLPAQILDLQLTNLLRLKERNHDGCASRRDLVEIWYAVLSAIHAPDFRWRLKLLTWQELAAVVPPDLQHFLSARYGIKPGSR